MKAQKLVYFILIFLVVFRYFSARPIYQNGQKIRVTTPVTSEPIKYAFSQGLKIAGLTTYLPLLPEINYGDKIIIEGTVNGKKLDNPKLVGFSETKNVFSVFRKKLTDFYLETLPQPDGGLLSGVILGSKGSITKEFWEKVKKTGVAHVVVASGTNVTFVTSFLISMLSVFLPRKKMIPLAILGIIMYLFVSGFEAPLVRAAIMSGLTFLSQESGRVVTSWKVLTLTALSMLAIRPDWIGDIGFILSFVSTASLMLFEGRIRKKLTFVPGFLKEGFSTSLAAQIGVTPILFVTFGYFNILSPVINALVLWTVPYMMMIGALGGIVGLISPALGRLILYTVYPFTFWFSGVVNLFT